MSTLQLANKHVISAHGPRAFINQTYLQKLHDWFTSSLLLHEKCYNYYYYYYCKLKKGKDTINVIGR